jgi:quinone-modifying oxidoreductase subunit QmoA
MSAAGSQRVMVIGGGIAGITAAVELADTGCEVVLVEQSPSLGGRVARMHQYFPKLCPPGCGLEMHFRRIRERRSLTVHTLAQIESISGSPGDFEVTVRLDPRYVNESCTVCGACAEACPAERSDEFNYGLTKTKAAYLPGSMAYPPRYVIDRPACPAGCKACVESCAYSAIDLEEQPARKSYRVAAIVAATGWEPYDAAQIDNLGFGRCANVVTNLMFERMAAVDGPSSGRIVRPSDGKEPRTVAFVQCAGSRDENHLPYCSAVCCAASIKHASYLRALYPETVITIFYIDLRTLGRIEEFQARVVEDPNIRLVRGKVAKIDENPATGDLLATAEDAITGRKDTLHFELVVLATGMVPQTRGLPEGFARDEFGFIDGPNGKSGLYAAGCVHRPAEVSATVQDATGAALKALQCARRSASHA